MQDNDFLKDLPEGVVLKGAEVSADEVTPEDLKQINKYALVPLDANSVFAFKAVIGDNETDDRNYEPFNLNALKDLKRLYVGKTVIKDHYRSAENQVARIYDTELITEPKTTGAGEPYAKLVAKCYMIRTDSNKDLIAEIQGGIKKEVSTGMRPKRAICSICGTDNTKTYCPHRGGREYDVAEGKRVCTFTLDGAKEAYELSLVAVPAQPRAGTTKSYGGVEPTPAPVDNPEEKSKGTDPKEDSKEPGNKDVELRLRAAESFLFTEKAKELEEE